MGAPGFGGFKGEVVDESPLIAGTELWVVVELAGFSSGLVLAVDAERESRSLVGTDVVAHCLPLQKKLCRVGVHSCPTTSS